MKRHRQRFSFPNQDWRTWRDLGVEFERDSSIVRCERCGVHLPLHQTNSLEVNIYEHRVLCDLCSMHESYL